MDADRPAGLEAAPDEPRLYSSGLFATSLSVLAAYLALGGLYYSRARNVPLLDGLFAGYALLSTTSLPDSFDLDPAGPGPMEAYRWLAPARNASEREPGARHPWASRGAESLALDSLYLLLGLNLVAACLHLARLWLSGAAGPRAPSCNGRPAGSLAGSLGQQGSFGAELRREPGGQLELADAGQLAARGLAPGPDQMDEQFLLQAASALASMSVGPAELGAGFSGALAADRADLVSVQPAGQIDLAELYVVSQQQHRHEPAEPAYGCAAQQAGAHQSDASFGSGRSSARSLCSHHQAQAQPASATLYAPAYGQAHLVVRARYGHQEARADEHQDAAQVERVLRTCARAGAGALGAPGPPGTPKQRRLEQANGLACGARPRPANMSNGFGPGSLTNEQDSSPNTMDTTNSQTISSASAGRRQHEHALGFALAHQADRL